MIRNFISTGHFVKIAWRNILKNKALFGINVFGLAIGLATFLTITLFVVDELSHDDFQKENIVRVVLNAKMGEENINEASVMAPVAATLKNAIPEIKQAVRIHKLADEAKVKLPNETLRNGKLYLADETFFDVFSVKMISGNPKTALQKPNSVVLTQDQAQLYFGKEDAMNKFIEINDIGIWDNNGFNSFGGKYTVTGIVEKIPANSHFHFDLLASMSSNTIANNQNWLAGQYYTYLSFYDGIDLKSLEDKINKATSLHFSSGLKAALGMNLQEFEKKGNKVKLTLQAIEDIHLYSNLHGEFEAGGSYKTVVIFSTIALLMLLIACFNYINLSTASASKRLKEIGMRKVLGSAKKQLVVQFLSESFLATVFAMAVGLLLFYFTLPLFNQLSGKAFEPAHFLTFKNLLLLPGLVMIISLLAGAYPAFFMSSFKPLGALKSKFTTGKSKGVRSTLVVFQFGISVLLIIGTLVVNQQMEYIQKKDIGYDRNALIVIRNAGFLGNKMGVFKDELKNDTRVKSISTSAYMPAGPTDDNMNRVLKANDPTQHLRIKSYGIDEAYLTTLGMKVIMGRNLSDKIDEKSNNILLNQTAVKAIGLAENPIGATIKINDEAKTVVGVVKDFHDRSLREPIEPLMLKYNPYHGLIVKAENKDIPGLLSKMEDLWNGFGSGESFNYAFLDELYNETYLKEAHMLTLLRVFAFLTIFIACLGLFGLITYTTQQRVKEIGVRKVLGSSVSQIVSLLARDFLKLVGISMFISFPIGYYMMDNWLEDFEYRTNISAWIFVVSGSITLLIAFLTIAFRSIKAALMNPVTSLKSE